MLWKMIFINICNRLSDMFEIPINYYINIFKTKLFI